MDDLPIPLTSPTEAEMPGVAAPECPTGRFLGRVAFQQMLRDAFACAAREGWREIIVCDPTFEDWPLGEREVCETLHAWVKQGRQFTMLAISYDEVVRRHARFAAWRTTWSHLVDCRSCRTADPQDLPSALWSPAWGMRRLDLEHSSGICGDEPQRRVLLRQAIDEWMRKSSPAFPASILGL
ncbi:hypothetical protein [Rhodoferax sp.]|uniref:hypothetical protein n=1 Tax=Rhodoferax sp. TaxID=50421 RepID=UPI00374DD19C